MVLLLHIFIIGIVILFAQVGTNANKVKGKLFTMNYWYLASFVVLLCFLGFRVNVGRDWNNYLTIFNYVNQQEFSFGESRELGFLFLCNFLKGLGLDFQSFIFTSSLITLFFFYISFRKYLYLLPFAIFIFFMDWGYPVVINTIRQGIALFAFMCALTYIDNNSKRAGQKYLFFCLIGAMFHYTIILFTPIYFLGKVSMKTNKLILLCISIFILAHFFIMPFYMQIMMLFPKYDHYAMSDGVFNDESTFRLGATLVLLLRLAPLFIYQQTIKNYPQFKKYFLIYFIGLSIFYGFYKFLLIVRFTFYLQFAEIFVISFFLYYTLYINKKYAMYGLCYIGLFLLNFVYTFDVSFLDNQILSPTYSLMFMDFSVK